MGSLSMKVNRHLWETSAHACANVNGEVYTQKKMIPKQDPLGTIATNAKADPGVRPRGP